MLPDEILKLVAAAEEALGNSSARYSGFRVGAALLSAGGRTFPGFNIENPSLMMSFCAERSALLSALAAGEKNFRAMAIVSGDGGYCYPCGSCRQMIAEFAPDIEVFIASDAGVKKYTVADLLPLPFFKA